MGFGATEDDDESPEVDKEEVRVERLVALDEVDDDCREKVVQREEVL